MGQWSATQIYIHTYKYKGCIMCTVHVPYMYCTCTVHVLYMYQYMYCTCTVHVLYMYQYLYSSMYCIHVQCMYMCTVCTCTPVPLQHCMYSYTDEGPHPKYARRPKYKAVCIHCTSSEPMSTMMCLRLNFPDLSLWTPRSKRNICTSAFKCSQINKYPCTYCTHALERTCTHIHVH